MKFKSLSIDQQIRYYIVPPITTTVSIIYVKAVPRNKTKGFEFIFYKKIDKLL